jgi:glutaminase
MTTPTTPAAPAALRETLEALHAAYRDLRDGQVASYIPELAKADPDDFAIAVCTPDGTLEAVGDARKPFTIQSVSKPITYGLALDGYGRDYVLTRVGVEPTGDAFNAISLDQASKRPHNPMINAGAIALAAMVPGASPTDRLTHMLEAFDRYVGHKVHVDLPVYISEKTTGHRNRAIAHLMLQFGMLDANVDDALDLYFQQCAILVDCQDLAVMAATLANGGVNPRSGERAVKAEHVKDILSVMYTCGMYDYSGEWVYRVGLPAKSGVGGGIIAVAPGRYGIAVYSPRLDARGNSVRGIQVCRELAERWGLHLFAGGA